MLAPAASAETYVVTGTADSAGICEGTTCTSIRQALASAASNAGADTIVVGEGTHQLSLGPLEIDSDVTLRGENARTTSIVANATGTVRAIEVQGASVTLSRLTLRGGRADDFNGYHGGTLRNQGGTVTLDRVRVTGGTAASGGGIANRNGSMLIDSSLIDHNAASIGGGDGGGIINFGGDAGASAQLTIRNTTIALNTARLAGGLISYGSPADAVVLEHVTIARNTALDRGYGGIVVPDTGLFSVGSSIVANNTAPDCGGAQPASAGYNLAAGSTCRFGQEVDVNDGTPALAGEPTNQGGDTDVLAIGGDSDARNLGSTTCPAADQRGGTRPKGPRCDAGAFELAYNVAVDSGPRGPTNDATPTFTFSSSEPITEFRCRIDGTPAACSDSYTAPAALRDGSYVFTVEAMRDGAPIDSATRAFEVDAVAPVAQITDGPPVITNAATLDFAFTANEPGARFQCAVGGDEPAACTSPFAVANPPEGALVFTVRAIDAAGNTGEFASRAVTIDRTAPAAPTVSEPASGARVRVLRVTGTAEADGSVRIESAGQPVATVAADTLGAWTTDPLDAPEGPLALQLVTVDRAGNASTPTTLDVVVDRTNPVVKIDSSPTDPTNESNVTFHFSANEPVTFTCRVVGPGHPDDPAAPCQEPEGAFLRDLENGRFTFFVDAVDGAGNSGQAQFAFTVNTLLPDTPTITLPTADPHHQSDRTVLLRGTGQDGSTIVIEAGGVPIGQPILVAGGVWERTLSDVAPGSHTYAVRATNATGSSAVVTRTVVIDVGPPVTFTETPPALTNDNTPTFAFTSADGASFRCALDAAPLESCNSPLTLPTVADGPHTFKVVASDAGGLAGDPATHAFSVDTQAPATPTLTGPSGPTTATTAAFTFSGDDAFECRLDAQTFTACTSPQSYTDLAEGPHEFAVVAVDTAGNRSEPATRGWIVDRTAPEPPVIETPGQDAWLASAAFDVSGTAEPGATVRLFEGTDERGLATATAGGAWTIALSGVGDGTHRYTARATDAAGNSSASPERSLRVDTSAPETTIVTGPGPFTNDATPAFAFGSDEPAATFECSLDGAAFAACPDEIGPLAAGTYTLAVRAVDAAGNRDATPAERTFTVDLTAPAAPLTDPLPQLTRVAQVAVKGTAEPLATIRVYDGGSLVESAQAGADGAWSLSLTLTDGQHELTARAVDRAGNQSPLTAPASVTVDTTRPTVTVEGPRVVNSTTPSFTLVSEVGARFDCTVDARDTVECPTAYTVAEPALADGPHVLIVVAFDTAGNASTPARVDFTVDTVKPTATITGGPAEPTNDTRPTFSFTADEAGWFDCAVDQLASVPCASPHRLLTAVADGPHTFSVTPIDAAGNRGTPVPRTFTVDTVAPTLTVEGPASPTTDRTPTFTFTPEAEATASCTLDGVELDTCTSPITLDPLSDGPHTFRVRATDRAGNVHDVERTIVIDTTAPVARITDGPDGTADITDIVIEFTSDDAAARYTCRLTRPDGATEPTPNCGTPFYKQNVINGPYVFEVEATDALGNSATARRMFTVDHGGASVKISDGPGGSTNNRTPRFTFTGSDDAEGFDCRLLGIHPQGPVPCDRGFYDVFIELREGTWTFEVRAVKDALNQRDPGPAATRTFTVDTTAPTASIPTAPAGPTREPRFTFATTEAATFRCRLDGGAFSDCESPYAPVLADGDHTLAVVAVDAAGNASAPVTRTFTVDTTPPAPADVTPAVDGDTATLTFTSGALCRLDGPSGDGAFEACASPRSYTGLAPGRYRFTVRTIDAAGNSSEAAREFTVAAVSAATAMPTASPTPRPIATPPPTPETSRPSSSRPVRGQDPGQAPGHQRVRRARTRAAASRSARPSTPRNGRVAAHLRARRGQGPCRSAIFYGGIFMVTPAGQHDRPQARARRSRPARSARAPGAAAKKQDAQALGRRQGQVPHPRPVQRGHRPRHQLARPGLLHRHAHPRHARASSRSATTSRRRRSWCAPDKRYLARQAAPLRYLNQLVVALTTPRSG